MIFGEVNPSGKLAETFPDKYEDCVTAKNGQFGVWDKITLEEGLYCGYRYFDRQHIAPAFCFGHGLSYTDFEYSGLTLKAEKGKDVKLTFTVKNVGKRAGAETAQIYIAPIAAQVDRPDKELKAFAKVELGAGRSKKVSLTLKQEDFMYLSRMPATMKFWWARLAKISGCGALRRLTDAGNACVMRRGQEEICSYFV